MNINVAKDIVNNNLGVKHKFFYRGARNQNEEFTGVINKAYQSIFTIETNDGRILSFCYSDVIIKNLEIID